jgi:hypothetical protein
MSKNTVKLKKYVDIVNEYEAAAAITPGMLLEMDSDGKVKAHATAGGNAEKMFALENELEGEGINDAYEADDPVQVWNAIPGEEVYAILADWYDVTTGDFLESNGTGYLQKHTEDSGSVTIYTNQIVGVALEDVDTSDSSGGESSGALGYNKRIKIKVV